MFRRFQPTKPPPEVFSLGDNVEERGGLSPTVVSRKKKRVLKLSVSRQREKKRHEKEVTVVQLLANFILPKFHKASRCAGLVLRHLKKTTRSPPVFRRSVAGTEPVSSLFNTSDGSGG